MSDKKVYTYRVHCDFELSFEAEDEADAADSLHTFLDHEGLDSDRIDVSLVDDTDVDDFEGTYFNEEGKKVST